MAQSNQGAQITKIGRLRTPKGIAAFAYLNKPDTSFGKSRYRINVFFSAKDPEFKTFVATLKKMKEEFSTTIGRKSNPIPVKKANEKLAETVGVKVGTPYCEFDTKHKEGDAPLPVFDARGKEDKTLDVWGGDIVRVEITMAGWELPTGIGIKGYLNAVQLLKAGDRTGARGASFEVEEEYLVDDDSGESPEADAGAGDDLEDETFGDEGEKARPAKEVFDEIEREAEKDEPNDDVSFDDESDKGDEKSDDDDPTAGLL